MSNYPYHHSHKENIVYEVKTYFLNYQNISRLAEIRLANVPGEGYYYNFLIDAHSKLSNLPTKYRKMLSNDTYTKQEFQNMHKVPLPEGGFFNSEEEAIQSAINVIEAILGQYFEI